MFALDCKFVYIYINDCKHNRSASYENMCTTNAIKDFRRSLTVSTLHVSPACCHIWKLPCADDTHSTHSRSETLLLSRRRTHLFLNSPMYTCRANSAKTMRQKMVSVITSANCLNECSSALMMVFRPVGTNKKPPVHTG